MNKWDVNKIKIEGIDPTEEYSELLEKENRGEITMDDIRRILGEKYRIKDVETHTVESELAMALFRLSFGKFTYEQAEEIAKEYAPKFDLENEALAHKGINWYAKELLKIL